MSTTNPTTPEMAEAYDTCLRWHVTSRTAAGETYLVDIAAYGGSGRCVCPDFMCRFEPILRQGITAEQAVDAGHGRPLPAAGIEGVYAATGPDGRVLALLEDRGPTTKSVVVIRPATLQDGTS
jgi:hypothetical protein